MGDGIEDLSAPRQLRKDDHTAQKQEQRSYPAHIRLGLGARQQTGQHTQHTDQQYGHSDAVEQP